MKTLVLNADFSERCVVDSDTLAWQASPSPLVQRRLLERLGGEVARATSIVRYEAGATFDAHVHELGEEIFVIDGTLSDEYGNYGPGTYLKNPPGSSHAPFSEGGCTLFVKLRHLDPEDTAKVVIHTFQSPWYRGMVDGLMVMPSLNSGPGTQRWCDGHRERTSIRTDITVERRSMWSKVSFRTSMEAIPREVGFAAPTSVNINRLASRDA